ncbi:aminoglycoside phosphotransferase family protein [Kineococcus endophyticus]|uniref:Aminoglycoside phosphotransferase family protein n=1 Tax=Kineococcus endophyticus TaxID=1181883 RepID=A0ABV3PCB9_9ACTN
MTDADAEDLVAEALGAAVTLVRTGSGGDHRSWWVTASAGRYVLRSAPDTATSRRLDREVRVRDVLRSHLAVPVPRAAATGTWRETRWTLDERLPGVDLETAPVTARTLEDLSRFLRGLHAVPLGAVRAMGAPDVLSPLLEPLRQQGRAAARDLGRPGDLPLPGTDEDGPVVLHADLKGEHLLVDGSGGLTAVLDWSDAGTGDPALDVEGLVLAVGADGARGVARGSGTPSVVVERGVFLARCRSAVRWAAALRGEPTGPEPLLRRQFHRAWG